MSFLLILTLTLYTSSYLLLIPALTCLHMDGHNLSSLAFPCTPVEGQNRLVQSRKRFKKKPQSYTELAESRRTENTDLKISLVGKIGLSLCFLRDQALGFCRDNYVCKTHKKS